MAVVEEVEEEEDREEEESDGEMPAEEEGMLVTEVVVKQSDETFSEVSSERFSTDEESINKELLARILVNADEAVGSECSCERFLRFRR